LLLMQNGFHSLALLLFPLPVHDDAAVKRIDDESCSHIWICHASWWMGSEQIDLQLLPFLPLSFFSWTLLENQMISKTFFFFF
jgi:hypothetical protein